MKNSRLQTTQWLPNRLIQKYVSGKGVLVVLSIVLFLSSCEEDYFEPAPLVYNSSGLRISMGGSLTRSSNADQVLGDMQVYCFDRTNTNGEEPPVGAVGAAQAAGTASLSSLFHHRVRDLVRNGMTVSSDLMRTGKWDAVMVSPQGATFTAPVQAKGAGSQLMYTFDPTKNNAHAHEFFHTYSRLPEVTETNDPYVNTSISRNVAKIRVVIERATDVEMAAPVGGHSVLIDGIPQYISWGGTLLKKEGSNYTTETENFDVFPNSTPEFKRNITFTAASEAGTFKSDTVDYIIPAHRGSDYWRVNATTRMLEPNPLAKDTIKKKITLTVNFTKASGGVFTKSAVIPYVVRCNMVMLLKVRMNDVKLEVKPEISEWTQSEINGNVSAEYLNVSKISTEIYDGSVSRIYFWSNQPKDSVYITSQGKTGSNATIADVNTIFDRLAGSSAANLHYNAATQEGYVDIYQAKTSSVLPQETTKIYLNAGGLKREIIVKRAITAQAAKNIGIQYAGTFHKASQIGERIITWNYSGLWNATVEGPAKNEVLIDRQHSPAFVGGKLYSSDIGDPELGKVGDWGSVIGNNRVYFRLGWKNYFTASEVTPARYATVVVRKGDKPGQGEVIKTIYMRQGEMSAPIIEGGTRKWSPYNVNTLNTFTSYPTQAGYFKKWNTALDMYAPIGVISMGTNFSDNVANVCPNGYIIPEGGESAGTGDFVDFFNTNIKSNWGFYADGYFDRQTITNGPREGTEGNISLGAVNPTQNTIGYIGSVFFNTTNSASIFFPAAGYRGGVRLSYTAYSGYYHSRTATPDIKGEKTAGYFQIFDGSGLQWYGARHYGLSIRCIATKNATITFNMNGATTGTAPSPIITKEFSTVIMPEKGNITKGKEYFSGWNTAPDGSGANYPVNSDFKVPTGGNTTLYARWLYIEEQEEIVIPNVKATGNERDVTFIVTGGNDNTASVVNSGNKWYTHTSIGKNKFKLKANQSPNSDPREATITLQHNSDPNYKVTSKVAQHFYTDIPEFDYFSINFNWSRNNDDLDLAVEFNNNKMINTGLAPVFDNKPVGLGFYIPSDPYSTANQAATYIEPNGSRVRSTAIGKGLLYWGGDALGRNNSGESVFFDAQKVSSINNLDRYLKLDIYAVWWGASSVTGKDIVLTIAAYKGGGVTYTGGNNKEYLFNGTNVYDKTEYRIPLKKVVTTNPPSYYDSNRGFTTAYQKIGTLTYDTKTRKSTVQWH